jgi:hypothetical protein
MMYVHEMKFQIRERQVANYDYVSKCYDNDNFKPLVQPFTEPGTVLHNLKS